MPIKLRIDVPGLRVGYRPILSSIMGGVAGGVWLSQLLYWDAVKANGIKDGETWDGFFYKSEPELRAETGLSRYECAHAKKQALKVGIVQHAMARVPRTSHYKMNFEVLTLCLSVFQCVLPGLVKKDAEEKEKKAAKKKAKRTTSTPQLVNRKRAVNMLPTRAQLRALSALVGHIHAASVHNRTSEIDPRLQHKSTQKITQETTTTIGAKIAPDGNGSFEDLKDRESYKILSYFGFKGEALRTFADRWNVEGAWRIAAFMNRLPSDVEDRVAYTSAILLKNPNHVLLFYADDYQWQDMRQKYSAFCK